MKKETSDTGKASQSMCSGTVKIPGTAEETTIHLTVSLDDKSVELSFADLELRNINFQISRVTVRNLLKYDELHFVTTNLPIKEVEMQWKANIARADNSVAGVIIVKPNKLKVVGEVGFSLVQGK